MFTCELLVLEYWLQSRVPRPPNVRMLLWYGIWSRSKRQVKNLWYYYYLIMRHSNPKLHLWYPKCQLQALCSSQPPARPGCTALGPEKAVHFLGPLSARSGLGSCCRKGTLLHWTLCWSRWRTGARSGCRAPLSVEGRSSCGSRQSAERVKQAGLGVRKRLTFLCPCLAYCDAFLLRR